MELSGTSAVIFVAVVFGIGYIAGMVHAGWSFALMLKRTGLQVGPGNTVIPIKQAEVTDEPGG